MRETDINYRQRNLPIHPPTRVVIVGVGGVGCWVAFDLALVGCQNIVLVDGDTIEKNNLNRTMFKYSQVGENKALAMSELILERRPECNVEVYPCFWERIPSNIRDDLIKSEVYDCRDATDPLDKWTVPITGGYNGLHGTLHVKPDMSTIFGDDENVRYTETPSYFGMPQLIGMLITNYVCVERIETNYPNNLIVDIDAKKLISYFRNQAIQQNTNTQSCKPVKKPNGLEQLFRDFDEDFSEQFLVREEHTEDDGEVFEIPAREVFDSNES